MQNTITILAKTENFMLTEQEVEKFADWLIKLDDQRMEARYPSPPRAADLTNDEILAELFATEEELLAELAKY